MPKFELFTFSTRLLPEMVMVLRHAESLPRELLDAGHHLLGSLHRRGVRQFDNDEKSTLILYRDEAGRRLTEYQCR